MFTTIVMICYGIDLIISKFREKKAVNMKSLIYSEWDEDVLCNQSFT